MNFLRKLRRSKSKRVFVIGLDGTPYTFFQKAMGEGYMPNLARMVEEGTFRRINSVYPTVSSVAWSSFMTGRNPGKHNIYGFIAEPDSQISYIAHFGGLFVGMYYGFHTVGIKKGMKIILLVLAAMILLMISIPIIWTLIR